MCCGSLLLSGSGADKACGYHFVCATWREHPPRSPELPALAHHKHLRRAVPLVRTEEDTRVGEECGGVACTGATTLQTQLHIKGCLFSLHLLLCNYTRLLPLGLTDLPEPPPPPPLGPFSFSQTCWTLFLPIHPSRDFKSLIRKAFLRTTVPQPLKSCCRPPLPSLWAQSLGFQFLTRPQ